MFSPLICAAQGPSVDNRVSYISFSIPGAVGTYPMSINASMVVTGYYSVSATVTRGFLRAADGTITTFSVRNGVQTVPESINDAGEITGFYEDAGGYPLGFLRNADGQVITFDTSCAPQYSSVSGNCLSSLPVSINAFGLIGGIHPIEPLDASIGFIRSRAGAITSFAYSPTMHGLPTILTGLNASGAAVGYYSATDFTPDATGDLTSFLLHPDGYLDQFSVPVDEPYFSESTAAESINDAGAIAGTYSICFYECASITTGGFVRSPEGEFTFFNAPGPIVREPGPPSVFFVPGQPLSAPHRLGMNSEGTITGSYTDVDGSQHGFVRNPYGTITSFDPPEGGQTTATSINQNGVIAGSYYYYRNAQNAQGFLRVPTP
jgi:hypothetical protein